jgi:hypothetical protein
MEITPADITEFVKNFNAGVCRDIPIPALGSPYPAAKLGRGYARLRPSRTPDT